MAVCLSGYWPQREPATGVPPYAALEMSKMLLLRACPGVAP
jgi:hypothetical protein